MSRRLAACERECIIGTADDDQRWRVYADTPSRFVRRLLAVARAWGVQPRRVGSSIEVELPLRAVRFAGPPRPLTGAELAQRRQAAAASQNARSGAGNNEAPLVSRGSPARAGATTLPTGGPSEPPQLSAVVAASERVGP